MPVPGRSGRPGNLPGAYRLHQSVWGEEGASEAARPDPLMEWR
jgi:hypothetical protein